MLQQRLVVPKVVKQNEWRAFLEELAGLFGALHVATADLGIDEGVEHAAARLLPLVVQRTSAADAWYATFKRVREARYSY